MKSGYTHQAKATKQFGIEFRSKLEAQWAYYFNDQGVDWDYADSPWFDFTIEGTRVEVKPDALNMFFDAIARVPYGSTCVVCLGSPPGVPIGFKSFSQGGRHLDAFGGEIGAVSSIRLRNIDTQFRHWWNCRTDSYSIIRGAFSCRYCGENELFVIDNHGLNVVNYCRNCRFINNYQQRRFLFRSDVFLSVLDAAEEAYFAGTDSEECIRDVFDNLTRDLFA